MLVETTTDLEKILFPSKTFQRNLPLRFFLPQELLKEREVPERAWIFYHVVTRSYTAAVRLHKQRTHSSSSAAGGANTNNGTPHVGALERQRSHLTVSAVAAASAHWDDLSAFEIEAAAGRPSVPGAGGASGAVHRRRVG